MKPRPAPLPPESLFTRCDPQLFSFETTAELPDSDEAPGQERAAEAVRFAIGMRRRGYNVFALGPEGTGRRSMVLRLLAKAGAERPIPADWVYVEDFSQPRSPKALSLPAGRGRIFLADMNDLVREVGQALPAAFEAEDYRLRRRAVEDEFKQLQEQALQDVAEDAEANDVMLSRTAGGLALAPMSGGEVLTPEQFKQLPEAQQDSFREIMEALQARLEAVVKQVPKWEREARARLRELERDEVGRAVSHVLEEIAARYDDLPHVAAHIQAAAADMADSAADFLSDDEERQKSRRSGAGDFFRRYRVNLLVDNAEMSGAPVVYEDYPTQPNVMGRIEYMAQYGALSADFTLIRAGSLHRANGGFLVVDAHKLLMNPFAWEDLKRALKVGQIRIESPGQSLGLLQTAGLEPEPIPLDVKVVLLGDPWLYYLLSHNDPEFAELFKVEADFDWRMDRTPGAMMELARSLATLARAENLAPLDRGGVARVVEQASRQVEDSLKLSTHMAGLADLLREADYWAAQDGADLISARHVQRALDAQLRRRGRVRENVLEEIERGIIHVSLTGAEIGQINGLAVLELGQFAFGHPARITARVFAGKGDVLDIEREVDLGGPLHGKGVMILTGFLSARFGALDPLSMSACLVFEQSYGGIDGDSASSAELYALLSAMAQIPLRQDLAVTGSVDQFGRVQAIGGVNEKIEGFFDLCAAQGLTGTQGVLIPSSNVAHLMLRADVVQACKDGKFAVYPVDHVDQGIELLTGIEAGERDPGKGWPAGSLNRKIQARLSALTKRQDRIEHDPPPPPRGS